MKGVEGNKFTYVPKIQTTYTRDEQLLNSARTHRNAKGVIWFRPTTRGLMSNESLRQNCIISVLYVTTTLCLVWFHLQGMLSLQYWREMMCWWQHRLGVPERISDYCDASNRHGPIDGFVSWKAQISETHGVHRRPRWKDGRISNSNHYCSFESWTQRCSGEDFPVQKSHDQTYQVYLADQGNTSSFLCFRRGLFVPRVWSCRRRVNFANRLRLRLRGPA